MIVGILFTPREAVTRAQTVVTETSKRKKRKKKHSGRTRVGAYIKKKKKIVCRHRKIM